MPDIQFEDAPEPTAKAHELQPVVQQLIEAGPDKVATIIADTEDEAKAFIRGMQTAAKQLEKGARKRVWEVLKGGKVKVGVAIGPKLTRNRSAKPANDTPETTPES